MRRKVMECLVGASTSVGGEVYIGNSISSISSSSRTNSSILDWPRHGTCATLQHVTVRPSRRPNIQATHRLQLLLDSAFRLLLATNSSCFVIHITIFLRIDGSSGRVCGALLEQPTHTLAPLLNLLRRHTCPWWLVIHVVLNLLACLIGYLVAAISW
jgi:hypothetical protein